MLVLLNFLEVVVAQLTPTRVINLRKPGCESELTSVCIEDGYFVEEFSPSTRLTKTIDLGGALILPGLVETHIHLDKACINDRCNLVEGTLTEAIEETSQAKGLFTEDDIYARGARLIERSIAQGTQFMRTHIELDPRIGLMGFNAIRQLQHDYSWGIELQLCVFPQEGLINNPGTEDLLRQALSEGATVLGGCPYTDSDSRAQIHRLFQIAQEFDCDLDFHLAFNLDAEDSSVQDVVDAVREFGWQNRVTIGHVTMLSALAPKQLSILAQKLASEGINVTSLPSTDLYLMGRAFDHNVPRGIAPLAKIQQHGVTCSISTNNVGNPFTPYGDCSLIRQANLFANVCQLGTTREMIQCLDWVSFDAAKILGLEHFGLEPGCPANFIAVDGPDRADVIREIQSPLMGFKNGTLTFRNDKPQLFPS